MRLNCHVTPHLQWPPCKAYQGLHASLLKSRAPLVSLDAERHAAEDLSNLRAGCPWHARDNAVGAWGVDDAAHLIPGQALERPPASHHSQLSPHSGNE